MAVFDRCEFCPCGPDTVCVSVQSRSRLICAMVDPNSPKWKPGFEPNVIEMSEQSRTAYVGKAEEYSNWRGPKQFAPPGWKEPPNDRDDPYNPPAKPDEPGPTDNPGTPNPVPTQQPGGTAVPQPLKSVHKSIMHPDENTHQTIYESAKGCPHKTLAKSCCGGVSDMCGPEGRKPMTMVGIGTCYGCQAKILGFELP